MKPSITPRIWPPKKTDEESIPPKVGTDGFDYSAVLPLGTIVIILSSTNGSTLVKETVDASLNVAEALSLYYNKKRSTPITISAVVRNFRFVKRSRKAISFVLIPNS